MTTPAELEALNDELGFIKGDPEYYNRRAQCMSGYQAHTVQERRNEGMPQADVGLLCSEVLKHSADIEANPKAKAERPEKDLLGPYRAISADKGFASTNKSAANVLKLYTDLAALPNVSAKNAVSAPVTIPEGPRKGETVEFILTPGSALDAAFTKEVLEAYKSGKVPHSTGVAAASLARQTNDCFRNAREMTIGQCDAVGKEQAAIYLQGNRSKIANQR